MICRLPTTIVLLLVFSSSETLAGTVSGYVRDSASVGVENAIVYFSNTRYGCSTDSLGYFSITGLPDGHYWLTISKAGYLRKEVDYEILGTDTVHIVITILVHPVELAGVDVWADSIGFNNPWKSLIGTFIPGRVENGYTIYNSTGKIPFGLLQFDTVTILYSLDTIFYQDILLVRLWILYANLTEHTHVFDPMHSVALTVIGRQVTYQDIPPIPYQQMKSALNEQEVIDEIRARIGGEIGQQSHAHADIVYENSRIRFPMFTGPLDWGTSIEVLSPTKQQALFSGSEGAGILKPYYIHSGAGVQGYIYFRFPSESEDNLRTVKLDWFRYFITLELNSTVHSLSFSVN